MAAEPLDDEIARRAARFEQRTNKPRPTDESVQIGEVEDETQNDQRRYKLGLENIDVSMGRLRPGEFTVIGALTGYGKTSLLEQIGRSNALDYKVFFATLEMTEAEIQSNMIAREMGLDLDDFERERASRTDKYAEALARTRALNLRLWRPPLGRAPNIQAIFKRAEQTSSDMLMIDYAALLEGWIPGNEAAKMVRYIQGQAKATGIHVVLLAQLQFEALGKRPTMFHMEDTKLLNKSPSTVILVHRPFAGKNPLSDTVAEMIIAKNRKGKLFRGHVHWYGPTHTFYAMTREDESRVQCCKKRPPKAKQAPKQEPELEPEVGQDDHYLDDPLPF